MSEDLDLKVGRREPISSSAQTDPWQGKACVFHRADLKPAPTVIGYRGDECSLAPVLYPH